MYHICTHVYACANKKLYYVTIFYEIILSFKEVEQMIKGGTNLQCVYVVIDSHKLGRRGITMGKF